MIQQAVALRRCASCDRWTGPRQPGPDSEHVMVESELTPGLCQGGPWDGSERKARSACGRWVVWVGLPEQPTERQTSG